MYLKQVIRFLHVSRNVLANEKSALATLRKKTGYTFSNCKKALELHNNDLIKVCCHEIINAYHKIVQTLLI